MSTITPLPTPPSRQDPANFSDRADEFLSALPTFGAELNVVAGEVNANATTASTNAGIATTAAIEATTARNEAVTLTESYQGSLSADPVLDKNGNPLSAGDWYIHSSTGSVRAYTGSDWVQGISSSAGVASVNGNNGVLTSKDVVPTLTANAGRVLKVNSSETDVEWGVGSWSGYQEFTSSGTWTKPAEATWVYVEAVGAGGGGGAGSQASGGGGGGFVSKLFRASELPASATVTIGAGGQGSVMNSGGRSVPGNGGNTTFGSFLIAKGGGRGGYNGNYATPAGAAIGGTGGSEWAAIVAGTSVSLSYSGYASANGGGAVVGGINNGGNSVMGGAGGGGISSSTDVGSGGISDYGGNGGDAVMGGSDGSVSYTAEDGSSPGGGGGAVGQGAVLTTGILTAGSGGNGRVRVWWW